MSDDVTEALNTVAAWLAPRLRANPDLRAAAVTLARATVIWLESLTPPDIPSAPPVSLVPPPPPIPPSPVAADPPVSPPPLLFPSAQPATLSIPFSAPPASGDGERELNLIPLDVVADRCRIKAEACRLVGQRLTHPDGGTPAAEADALRHALTLPDCPLWMLTRESVVTTPKAWKDLASAFAVAGNAAILLRDWEQVLPALAMPLAGRILGLVAEAQSVLYYAVEAVRDVKVDFDQVQLFAHVRSAARDRQVFIPKFLKREDRADPGSWPSVAQRIEEAARQIREIGTRDRARHKSLKNLEYKLNKLRGGSDAVAGEWPRVLELVDELVTSGLPPSNADLRDLLLPVLEDIPDDPPPSLNVRLVLREIDRYLETRPEAEPPVPTEHDSAEVAEVADLLRGREVVLIGGQARPAHKAALMRAFGLADVRWLSTPDHTSFTVFEPDVARPEVAVVLLAIRWSNHDYDGVRAYCEAYGKPLVRLPGGYNANQVAHNILTQAGERLRAVPSVAG